MLSPDSNDTIVSHCSSVKKPRDCRCTAVEFPGKWKTIAKRTK